MTAHQIANYLDGVLAESESRAIKAHLADCQACANILADLKEPLGFDVGEPINAEDLERFVRLLRPVDPDKSAFDRRVLRDAEQAGLDLGAVRSWFEEEV